MKTPTASTSSRAALAVLAALASAMPAAAQMPPSGFATAAARCGHLPPTAPAAEPTTRNRPLIEVRMTVSSHR
jgi:hypothetical protein